MGLTQITTGGIDDNINIDNNTLKVDATNNRVGIGEASPSATLHAKSGTTDVVADFESTDANAWIQIRDNSTTDTAVMVGAVGDEMRLRAGSNERVRIDSSGNVGIGTTSPAEKLELRASSGSVWNKITNGTVAGFFGVSGSGASVDIYGSTNHPMRFFTNAAERMRINSSGNVGIGVSSLNSSSRLTLLESAGNAQTLEIKGANSGGVGSQPGIKFTANNGDNIGGIYGDTNADAVILQTGGTERMRIDSSGRLLVGTSSTSATCTSVFAGRSDGATDPVLRLEVNSTSPANGSALGGLNFASSGLSAFQAGARIAAVRDGGTWTNGSSHPTYLEFATTADGASSPTERMRIGSSGDIAVNTTTVPNYGGYTTIRVNNNTNGGVLEVANNNVIKGQLFYDGTVTRLRSNQNTHLTLDTHDTERMRIDSAGHIYIGRTVDSDAQGTTIRNDGFLRLNRDGSTLAVFNRNTNDGQLVQFRQGGIQEGDITVSGSTVSYNGGHLSRYSQLPSGAERTEILRGSVLSNLDEMCEWGEEDNEQLNRMKVSDVEGDVNVSGVFQGWDDDDDTYTNDFYCAMTGDFVIRIAQGTTVARGDLLMSAGDGTAKPQDDDIVRSKTIAKVTSTTVSTTYSDGSYCVPCVLMAC